MADLAEDRLLQLQADVSALQASLAQQALTSTSAQADALDLRNQLTQQAASTAAAEATVQALQATVTAAATAAAGTQAATAPVFYVAPASATGNTFLDLASSHGAKHFKVASEPLNSLPFDFKDDSDLQLFLDLVLIKSQHWGWTSLFCIPVTTKLFEGTQYHVNCPFHKNQWVAHPVEECHQNPANNNPSSRRLQRAQLAAALLEEPEATDEEDDEDDP